MESLRRKNEIHVVDVSLQFKRFLFYQIDWEHRFVAIVGARGSGKTTLLLQYLKENYSDNILYASLDDFYFTKNTLYSLAEEFYMKGGRILLLDEVHKYPNWQRELKNIYDTFSKLQVIFTGSSILHIYSGDVDLSRRVLKYELPHMSFREYLNLAYDYRLPAYTLDEILSNHLEVAQDIIGKISTPLKYFEEYLVYGQYPFFIQNKKNYHQLLRQIVSLTIEDDFKTVMNVDYQTIFKLKKLLYIVAGLPPFKPNITKLASETGVSRENLVKYLTYLDRAHLLKLLYSSTKGISKYRKPEKIYLANSNLLYALNDFGEPAKGTVRELFFLSQVAPKHNIFYTDETDFVVDNNIYFEIGGKSKTRKQISGLKNAFVLKDDVLLGHGNVLPLWLLGFLY